MTAAAPAGAPATGAAPAPGGLEIKAVLTLDAAAGGAGGKLPTFTMVANSGVPMALEGWRYPVVLDLSGGTIPSQNRPVRFNHDAEQGVGHTTAIKVDGGRIVAAGVISRDTPAAREVVSSAKNGFPWQASVGANADAVEWVPEGKTTTVNGKTFPGPLNVALKWTLGEISIVDLGADGNTSVNVSATQGGRAVPTPTERDDPIMVERARVREIRGLCRGEHPQIEAQAIDNGWDVPQTAAAVLTAVRSSRPVGPSPRGGAGHGGGPADPKATLTCAAMMMSGRVDSAVKAFGEQFVAGVPKPHGWYELAAMALRMEGRDTAHMSRMNVLADGFSTVSMPSALGLGVEKIALDVFIENSQNWRALARVVPVATFREGKAIRLAGATRLEQIGPDGELKSGSLGEDSFKVKVDTYGKILTLTRQSIVNDDLGILDNIPTVLGIESARTVSDLVFGVLTSNPGAPPFFGTGNANVVQGALDLTTLSEAIRVLRTRTDSDGRIIGLAPVALTVPASLESTARALLNSIQLFRDQSADMQPAGNPLAGLNLTLVVEPRLDAVSEGDWYLSAAPMHGAVLCAFLDGIQGCRVESQQSEFNTLGFSYRAYMDVGASLGESRAIVKGDDTPYM